MQTGISTRFSFQGWDWKKWLAGNKDLLKWIIPAGITFIVTHGWIEAGAAAIVGKFILDIIDFYVSEVPLTP